VDRIDGVLNLILENMDHLTINGEVIKEMCGIVDLLLKEEVVVVEGSRSTVETVTMKKGRIENEMRTGHRQR
jgi:hypothetical protein